MDEYSNSQVNNTVKYSTAKNNIEKLTVGNPHAPGVITKQLEKLTVGNPHAPDVLTNQARNGHHTVHNPDKPGEPTDTKANKESPQKENPAPSGASGRGRNHLILGGLELFGKK